MNRYKRFVWLIFTIEILLLLLFNGYYIVQNKQNDGRMYRVEAERVARELQEKSIEEIDLSQYSTIIKVSEFQVDEVCNNDYVVEEAVGRLYRIEYRVTERYKGLFYINGIILTMMTLTVIILLYVERKILKPFHDMSNLSYELAKGNLSVPIKEEKSKFFGRFLWGMDMLREKLEDDKEKELALQKDKKTLILSLSHDIKTPLSSIELYARALSENLYDTQEKRDEALCGITRNVKEIKKYVDEIVTASREDFLNLEVNESEFYLSEAIKATQIYYSDKLSVIHTQFVIEECSDCLLKGDKNRLIEVLQNIMENAIKYGDGERIQIFCDEEEDCKLIHIENSGCSLKEEELPNLFDSFYRGSNSHGIKGNGLGLYICKNLMKKMDGDVFAQMSGETFGVTVVIRRA